MLRLGSERKEATNNEKIAGEHGLLLVLGDGEGVNEQLTRTHGGLLGGGGCSVMREVAPMIYSEATSVKKKRNIKPKG